MQAGKITKEMIQQAPKKFYTLFMIDFGNIGHLTEKQRLHVMNFFISTVDEIHSSDGFLESSYGLVDVKLDSAREKKLKEEIKKIFDETPSQNELIGKIITFFLDGNYPDLPSVMANFGRSQAMLNNIFDGLSKDAKNLSLNLASIGFGNAVTDKLIKLLAVGTLNVFDRVDAAGNRLYINKGNFDGVLAYGVKTGISWLKSKFNTGQKDLGESCKSFLDCKNFSTSGLQGITCCNDVCQQKKKDWAGWYYCPLECKSSFLGEKGTCK